MRNDRRTSMLLEMFRRRRVMVNSGVVLIELEVSLVPIKISVDLPELVTEAAGEHRPTTRRPVDLKLHTVEETLVVDNSTFSVSPNTITICRWIFAAEISVASGVISSGNAGGVITETVTVATLTLVKRGFDHDDEITQKTAINVVVGI